MSKLPLKYYLQDDVVALARDLIGKELVTCFDGLHTSGIISETEAYNGIVDKASHAYNNRRTARTEIMFGKGGVAYVYLCYGIHSLFNVVTNVEGTPHAILIRGVIPKQGVDVMLKRRDKKKLDKTLSSGPGTVAMALGIHYSNSGLSLSGNQVWIEKGIKIPDNDIEITPRIGVDYAKEDALLPYRFLWKKSGSIVFKSR